MKPHIGRTIIRTSPFIAGILIVIEIILTNQLVAGGKTVRSIDILIDEFRHENALLEQKVASASSLATITLKAKELGFIEPAKSQFLTITPSELSALLTNRR